MGRALEIISGSVVAPGATITQLTMNTGNSATVRNTALTAPIALLSTWATNNVEGIWRIRSPKLHDNVQGLRYRAMVDNPMQLWAMGIWQKLWPQDNLTLELSGSAVGGNVEQAALMIYYNDLPGAQARMISVADLMARTVNVWTTEVPITPAVAGDWSGQVAINSEFDNFKANTDYALIGFEVDATCHAVGFTSPDFANLRVGGPGNDTFRHLTGRWFYHLAEQTGLPFIPVFNSANKFSTLVDIAQDQGLAAVNVTALLHELSSPQNNTSGFPVLS